MWLRAAGNRFLTRGFAAALAVLVCGSALDFGHFGGDDPECNVAVVAHDHAAHRLSGAASSSSSSGEHCYICHSLRLLHVGLAARREGPSVDRSSTLTRTATAIPVRQTPAFGLSPRAPPAVPL